MSTSDHVALPDRGLLFEDKAELRKILQKFFVGPQGGKAGVLLLIGEFRDLIRICLDMVK